MSDEEEVALCYQCGWPLRRGQAITWVHGYHEECDGYHVIGAVHMNICALDMAMGVLRATTQKKLAGAGGLN